METNVNNTKEQQHLTTPFACLDDNQQCNRQCGLCKFVEDGLNKKVNDVEVKVDDDKNTSYNSVTDFMKWKDSLYSENRGGKIMYDVKGWYKWLEESELLDYFLTRVI